MLKKLFALVLALLASVAFAAVDANSGDAAQLDGVKGIGPALSAKIVAARKSGPFKDWNDFIARVPGVGDKSAAKLSEAGLTVNGASLSGAAPAPVKATKPAKAEQPAVAAPKEDKPAAKDDKASAKADKAAAKAASKAEAKAEKAEKAEKAASKAEVKAGAKAAASAPDADSGKKDKKKSKKDKAEKAASAAKP